MTDGPIRAVDLFCGAGGLSAGLALACEELARNIELAAVNHWETAIASHGQIGNAVPVNLAKALCQQLLTTEDPTLEAFSGGEQA